jgi:hypothetical protein
MRLIATKSAATVTIAMTKSRKPASWLAPAIMMPDPTMDNKRKAEPRASASNFVGKLLIAVFSS